MYQFLDGTIRAFKDETLVQSRFTQIDILLVKIDIIINRTHQNRLEQQDKDMCQLKKPGCVSVKYTMHNSSGILTLTDNSLEINLGEMQSGFKNTKIIALFFRHLFLNICTQPLFWSLTREACSRIHTLRGDVSIVRRCCLPK